ncbi:MAG: polysaccharide biosynthesis/export family protein [Bacteroidetes bacterium]|nr:polysaccharide biosynthesis/export family protein [Bacteroidota bacterium]
MKKKRSIINSLLLFIVALSVLSSCIPIKKQKYMVELGTDTTVMQKYTFKGTTNLVKAGDYLYIQILTLEPKSTSLFSSSNPTSIYQTTTDQSVYLNSYEVESDGMIEFPFLGRVEVAGLTIEQVRNKLQKNAGEYYHNATVSIKQVNFNITLLGELTHPGQYKIYQKRVSVFDAIGMAGDLTAFGNRKNIILVRQTETGAQSHRLDLSSKKIIESEFYFLRPNDMLYVEPLKEKKFAFEAFPYALILSTISTTILILSYIKK